MLMLLVVAGMATFTSCKKEKQENPEQENLAPNGITVYPPASEYHYNGDGTLDYRTDHTAEGTVHGGYNPKKPNATF